MKKLLIILNLIIFSNLLNAQCIPNPQYTSPGIYPDSITGLSNALVGQSYNEIITIVVDLDSTLDIASFIGWPTPYVATITIDDIEIISVSGLPNNFSYACVPNSCAFPGGNTGCLTIYSTSNPTIADIGTYNIDVAIEINVSNVPLLSTYTLNDNIDYYTINVIPCSFNNNIAVTDITCNGGVDGSISISNSIGGIPPYIYQWSGPAGFTSTNSNISNLGAGTYTCAITDANGCTDNQIITLTEPPALILDTSISACNSYTWEGVTYTQSGTYTNAYTNSLGCDSVSTVTLGIINEPNPNILGITNVNTLQVETYSVGINPNSTYDWSLISGGIILNGINSNSVEVQWGNNTGTFELIVTEMDGLCIGKDTIDVNVINTTFINDYSTNKELLKVTDLLGRETKQTNQPLFYIYDDGTVEKKLIIE